jgi:hypothetical protein
VCRAYQAFCLTTRIGVASFPNVVFGVYAAQMSESPPMLPATRALPLPTAQINPKGSSHLGVGRGGTVNGTNLIQNHQKDP